MSFLQVNGLSFADAGGKCKCKFRQWSCESQCRGSGVRAPHPPHQGGAMVQDTSQETVGGEGGNGGPVLATTDNASKLSPDNQTLPYPIWPVLKEIPSQYLVKISLSMHVHVTIPCN